MALELTPQENALLRSLLQQELRELDPQLHHTFDNTHYRHGLRERGEMVKNLLDRLTAALQPRA